MVFHLWDDRWQVFEIVAASFLRLVLNKITLSNRNTQCIVHEEQFACFSLIKGKMLYAYIKLSMPVREVLSTS